MSQKPPQPVAPTMPTLEVREQAHLPFKRLAAICMDSISHRLMRSVVTLCIVTLAIAFLAHIMADGSLGHSMRNTATEHTRGLTANSRFLNKISRVDPEEKLVRSMARVRLGTSEGVNLSRWGEFTPSQTDRFIQQSRTLEQYLEFFRKLPVGRRILLIGQNTGLDIFDWLYDPQNFWEFSLKLNAMKSVKLPTSPSEFQDFLTGWKAYHTKLLRVSENYSRTVDKISAFCAPTGPAAKLQELAGRGEEVLFFHQLNELGFQTNETESREILQGMKRQQEIEWAFNQLRKTPVAAVWDREFQERFNPSAILRSCAGAPGRVEWIRKALEKAGQSVDFDEQRFARIAATYKSDNDLLTASQELTHRYGGERSMDEKTLWLIVVSFLVCVIGIANAMLMSVLERFKEIATMKCLGARNRTIAYLFIIESGIMGVLGGLVGIFLGLLIALGRQILFQGSLVFQNFPFAGLGWIALICLACSLFLAAVAAIYPSGVAARMAPLEAMRVD